ncbi:hypothetical protein KI387_011582, partial [Taxus chinensis]
MVGEDPVVETQVVEEHRVQDSVLELPQEAPPHLNTTASPIQEMPLLPPEQGTIDMPIMEPESDEMFPWMKETIAHDTCTVQQVMVPDLSTIASLAKGRKRKLAHTASRSYSGDT